MSENIKQDIAQPALPNLFWRVLAVVFVIWLAILVSQFIQNYYQQEEILETERINRHHEQLELMGRLVNAVLTFKSVKNEALKESSLLALRTTMNEVKWTRDESLMLAQHIDMMDEGASFLTEEGYIAQKVDSIVIYANEVLAIMESGTKGNQYIEDIYNMLLIDYQDYEKESLYLIRNLSKHLHYESEMHRKISWWSAATVMLLVLMFALRFYQRGKRLVHQQFDLIDETNKLLAKENNLLVKAEQNIAIQAEINLAQQMKLGSILDSTVDAIITITSDGKVDSFNKAAESMFGYPASYMVGQNVKILMPEPFVFEYEGDLQRYFETGEATSKGRELTGKRVDGSEFPCYLSVNDVHGSNPQLFTGIIQDITAWKKADAKLHTAMANLTEKQAQLEQEEQIARHVFETIIAANNDTLPELGFWAEPMRTLSGDMMLSSVLPDGRLRILLCDFTGHGLPAALGAVPVSSIYSAMTSKNLPLEEVMDELNKELRILLPTGIFSCIGGIDIDKNKSQARVWNAGLPDMLLVNQAAEIKQRFVSTYLPIGVIAYTNEELKCEEVTIEAGDCFYMYSDGLTEAENAKGEHFGIERLEKILTVANDGTGRIAEIKNKVNHFVGDTPATDDISLIEIKMLVIGESNL